MRVYDSKSSYMKCRDAEASPFLDRGGMFWFVGSGCSIKANAIDYRRTPLLLFFKRGENAEFATNL